MERAEMPRIRLAVWAQADDFAKAMNPPREEDDGQLAAAMRAMGLREG